jgi:hypothetical protein
MNRCYGEHRFGEGKCLTTGPRLTTARVGGS